jgi:hypothetical protein
MVGAGATVEAAMGAVMVGKEVVLGAGKGAAAMVKVDVVARRGAAKEAAAKEDMMEGGAMVEVMGVSKAVAERVVGAVAEETAVGRKVARR